MKPTNSSAIQYNPADPPSDPALLQNYLRQEFAKMKAAIDLLSDGYMAVTYAAPDRPRIGMMRYADGEQWNPGFGAGPYYFSGMAWMKMDMAAFALFADGSANADGANKANGMKLLQG